MADEQRGAKRLDPAVRNRVMQRIGPLVDALDEAVANPTPARITKLREASDELMRGLARVMLDLGSAE